MVWIVHIPTFSVREVAMGSPEMQAARNVHDTEEGAIKERQSLCAHDTKLGHRDTGAIFCADCGKSLNEQAGAAVPDLHLMQDEAQASHRYHYRRAQTLVGMRIRVLSDYNDQVFGSSKKSLKGHVLAIKSANISDGRLIIVPVGCRTYMNIGAFELITCDIKKLELGDRVKSEHQYDVEVGVGKGDGYHRVTVLANAKNRDAAAKLAEMAGFEVCSVNMVG